MGLTVTWPIGKEDQAEVRVDHNVPLAFLHLTYASTVGQGALAVPREATEDRDDVFGGLVGLVDDDHPPEHNRA